MLTKNERADGVDITAWTLQVSFHFSCAFSFSYDYFSTKTRVHTSVLVHMGPIVLENPQKPFALGLQPKVG